MTPISDGQNKKQYEVLVVDDVPGAAQTFADLIADKVAVSVAAADTPQAAISLVENNPIRVVVLDEKMPTLSGTELFQRIRLVDASVVAIMLTGEAGLGEASEALRLGYAQILEKRNIAELPEAVTRLYYRQLAESVTVAGERPVMLSSRRRRIGMVCKPEVRLVRWDIIEPFYVRDEDWQTYLQIAAGQQVSQTVELTARVGFELLRESREELRSSLGVRALKVIEGKLEDHLTASSTSKVALDTLETRKLTVSYSLPQPELASALHIVARNYQAAPVYQRVRAVMEASCDVCQQVTPRSAVCFVSTGRYATRHEEFLSDGTVRVVETGTA